MSRIYGSALELIGHTPLIEAKRLEKKENLKARLLIKTCLLYTSPSPRDCS